VSHCVVPALALTFLAGCDRETPGVTETSGLEANLGNNFPEPGHDFHLNIIGVPKDKTGDFDGSSGRRIFVQLESDNVVGSPGGKNNDLSKGGGNDQNHIYLCNSTNDEGDSTDPRCAAYGNPDNWGVIDANATDGDGALIAVPDPCAGSDIVDGCTPRYSVWARARAGGNATLTTCATEEELPEDEIQDTWCGGNGINLYPTKGRKAQDVSGALLFMTISVDDALDPELAACIDPDGDSTDLLPDSYDVYLFDRCFENYFWNYDNNGLKNLELRFYWAPVTE
jgi:hypothetical protein